MLHLRHLSLLRLYELVLTAIFLIELQCDFPDERDFELSLELGYLAMYSQLLIFLTDLSLHLLNYSQMFILAMQVLCSHLLLHCLNLRPQTRILFILELKAIVELGDEFILRFRKLFLQVLLANLACCDLLTLHALLLFQFDCAILQDFHLQISLHLCGCRVLSQS